MNSIIFRPTEKKDREALSWCMKNLYIEDPGTVEVTQEKIQHTIQSLQKYPEFGTIMVFERNKDIIGYAILVNFWSNEYGGNLLNIDELYITKEFRGMGIATAFLRHVMTNKPNNAIGLQLEVTPKNKRARKLYTSLGFRSNKNETLMLTF